MRIGRLIAAASALAAAELRLQIACGRSGRNSSGRSGAGRARRTRGSSRAAARSAAAAPAATTPATGIGRRRRAACRLGCLRFSSGRSWLIIFVISEFGDDLGDFLRLLGLRRFWLSWFGTSLPIWLSILALALSSAGLVKTPGVSSSPGVTYALSMPVSRRKLAGVRMAIGIIELAVAAILT